MKLSVEDYKAFQAFILKADLEDISIMIIQLDIKGNQLEE